jgi:hypothetical protein
MVFSVGGTTASLLQINWRNIIMLSMRREPGISLLLAAPEGISDTNTLHYFVHVNPSDDEHPDRDEFFPGIISLFHTKGGTFVREITLGHPKMTTALTATRWYTGTPTVLHDAYDAHILLAPHGQLLAASVMIQKWGPAEFEWLGSIVSQYMYQDRMWGWAFGSAPAPNRDTLPNQSRVPTEMSTALERGMPPE